MFSIYNANVPFHSLICLVLPGDQEITENAILSTHRTLLSQ